MKLNPSDTKKLIKKLTGLPSKPSLPGITSVVCNPAPDREKIEKYLNDLVSMPVPTLSDPAMVKVMVKISVNLTAFREQAIASVEVA